MIIPSQLPQFVATTRSGALQALALQAGQILSGEVIGPAPNGGTQVQISGQLLNLLLPQAAKAGETLKFEVQGSGAQLRLALQVSATGPQAAAALNTRLSQLATVPPAPQSSVASPSVASPSAAAQPSTPPAGAPQPSQTAPAPLPGAPASPGATPQAPTSASPAPAAAANTALPRAATSAEAASSPLLARATQPAPASAPASQLPSSPGIAANPVATAAPAAGTGSVPTVATPGQAAATSVPRPVAPYPSAAPVIVVPPGTAAAATAAVAGSPGATAPLATAPIVAASITPVLASTPEAALAQMVQTALPQQNTIANLVAALTSIAGKIALPEPVVRAAQQVLANRVVLDGGKLDGAGLQKAILNSGVFQEASLARAGTPLLEPQADMKSALLALRQSLSTWLGQQPQLLASMSQVAPPLRGKIPRVPVLDIAPIDPADSVDETGKHLLDRTEAALARTRLHQHASLPDPHVKGADLSTDLPVVIGGQQSLLQLQIHRDQHNGSETTGERGWQMRFAINLPGMGEVGAQVSLRGSATGIMLWAAERETTDALAADIDGLRAALSAAGLSPGALIVRHGAPVEAPQPASSGHLVDSRR